MSRIKPSSKRGQHGLQIKASNGLSKVGNQNYKEPYKQSEFIRVIIRLTFLRIGEIDTLNERYQAQAAIEARWPVSFDTLTHILSSDDQQRLAQGQSVPLIKYAEYHWHPQLFIENALGDFKEEITYTAKRSVDQLIYICEHRQVKGQFWEKLELYHFPSDVQELSISVGSTFYDDKVILMADPSRMSAINREAFVDQQEWSLYEHVDTEQRFVKEFLLDDENGDESQESVQEERKRSFLVVSCHAGRQSQYYYWNGFCLMFLITICSFCIFSIPPTLPQNRLQIGVTLLLTSITFRWTVNRSLPTISYLTSMDKYSIISIFFLVIVCIWHAAIGALVFVMKHYPTTDTDDIYVWIDRYVFFGFLGIFLIMHVVMIIWLLSVPHAYRRQMKRKDEEYRAKTRSLRTISFLSTALVKGNNNQLRT